MKDTPESIRRKIEETKVELLDNLESLQRQVSETVRSASGAVDSTVDSVKDTITAVTQGAQDTVQACQNALDVPRQIDRHPWLLFSGAIGLGFVAVKFLEKSKSTTPRRSATALPVLPSSDSYGSQPLQESENSSLVSASMAEADRRTASDSPWQRLGEMAVSSVQTILQDAASRATAQVIDYLAGSNNRKTAGRSSSPPRSPSPHESPDPPSSPSSAVAARQLTGTHRGSGDNAPAQFDQG
jgi:hypothetical protein